MTVRLLEVEEIGPFTFRWPEALEHFERGWEGTAEASAETVRFRYGLGERTVYGRMRAHSVVWIGGQPVAEGVGTDDHATSRSLVSRIKGVDRKVVRDRSALPPGLEGLEGLEIVQHRDAIDAPYSPRCLAVKLPEDDATGWVTFALAARPGRGLSTRSATRPRVASATSEMRADERAPRASPRGSFDPVDDTIQRAVVLELIAFEERSNGPLQRGVVQLTADEEADRFVREDDFAFLLAVLFDQGVPYGRAWRAPLVLRERLGHLDPGLIAAEPERVRAAIAGPPALHRYVKKLPAWVVSAARKVLDEYGGAAGNIWRGQTAAVVRDRLDDFIGISQKKAAMTLMLLWRCRDEDIQGMQDCDVAVDVHLRRVFLRTGLVSGDESRLMIDAARRLYPELPGALDPPAWVIGQRWCRPRAPTCDECALGAVCPRLIERGNDVVGS
ncbi:MAG: hypothetical protein WEE66_02480 [Actinomycetota bacterium]